MNRSSWFRVGVSILPLVILVNGWAFGENRELSKQFNAFIEHLLKDSKGSEDATLIPGRAKFLGLEAGSALKRRNLGVEDGVTDGFDHSCELVLDNKKKKVLAVVFTVEQMVDEQHNEMYCFRLSPRGSIQRTAITRGLLKDGNPVVGSGRAEIVNADSPAIHEKLQHEIDFWLMGKYRKAKVSAAVRGPGSPATIRDGGQ